VLALTSPWYHWQWVSCSTGTNLSPLMRCFTFTGIASGNWRSSSRKRRVFLLSSRPAVGSAPRQVNYPAASGGALAAAAKGTPSEQPALSSIFRFLVLDVPFDQIGGNVIAGRSNIVAISPQLATPMRPTQPRKLGIQLAHRHALHYVHHLRRRITGRTTDEQVYVIYFHRQRFYLPVPRRANLTDEVLQSLRYIPSKYLPPIAGYPDKMVCQSVDRVCTTSGFLHAGDYSMARSRGPLRGSHAAGRKKQRTAVPAFGGPAFLPAASGGVSSRRLS